MIDLIKAEKLVRTLKHSIRLKLNFILFEQLKVMKMKIHLIK